MRKTVQWSHMAVIAWAALWMLVAPLMHIHPEADHHHGEAGHIHGGIVHAVFSPDLDGEYDHQHVYDRLGYPAPSSLTISDHPSHPLDNAEFEFSFLSNSTERKLFKPIFVPVFTDQPSASLEPAQKFSVVAQHRVVTPPRLFLTRDIPSRAPPPHFI
jgi:hypothetical protein